MKKYGSKLAKTALFLLPLALGVTGFAALEQVPLADALFQSIQMYTMGYEESPPNLLLELARWTAPLATLSGIVVLFRRLKERAVQGIRYLRGGSVAVYGEEESRGILLKQLGNRGIEGRDELVRAERYILVGSEQENLAFYTRYHEQLADHEVYLKSETTRAHSLTEVKLHPFRTEELAARLFWKQRFLYPRFLRNGGKLSIVLLGFGSLGEEVLTFGLQNLIYAPEQKLEWHIFGDGTEFRALHPELDRIGEKICFHREPWFDSSQLLEQADLVVVLSQEKQSVLTENLLSVLHRQEMDVFADSAAAIRLLNEENRLRVFDWKRETQKPEYILEDRLLERAKGINLRYAHLYGQVEETEENAELEWNRLNTFTRYSNISAADYHDVRLKMLEQTGVSGEQALDNPKALDLLAHLEHIRWCRYHYLNNWAPGTPADGKAKDPQLRIHRDLVPYADLSEGEKEKDRENIRVLFSAVP